MGTLVYNRPGRGPLNPVEAETIAFKAPPAPPGDSTGLSATLMQFLPMVIGMAGSFAYLIVSHISVFSIVLMAAVIPLTLGVSLFIRWLQTRDFKKQWRTTRAKHLATLKLQGEKLARDAKRQREVATIRYPSPQEVLNRIAQARIPERLWERRWEDNDFLCARVGQGIVPIVHTLTREQSDTAAQHADAELEVETNSVLSKYQNLADMPKVINLRRAGVVSVVGDGETRRALTRSLLVSLAYNHSPEDLRILVYAPPASMEQWRWFKWLPHARVLRPSVSEPRQLCMMADTAAGLTTLLTEQIKPEFDRRSTAHREQHDGDTSVPAYPGPHILMVLDGYDRRGELGGLTDLNAILKRTFDDAKLAKTPGTSITILALSDTDETEPTYLFGRITVHPRGISGTGMAHYHETHMDNAPEMQAITLDAVPEAMCEQIARALAPISLAQTQTEANLAQEVRLLPLLGYQTVDEITPQRLWQRQSGGNILDAVIGRGENGKGLTINLRTGPEGGIGPFGMLVGQSGLGKSEFLRTIALSLAMTHTWEEVNFVFVDYKGDTVFADLASLPHTVGMVTRVQQDSFGDVVQRLSEELKGERARRAGFLSGFDSLAQYQARRRQQLGQFPPLPYLLIVIDEFAALLAAHPELKHLITEIAQEGRSLGMTFLLSAQSPSEGRLAEFESHLTYRVSVRSLSVADSNAAIGSSAAFHLPAFTPGLAYLKSDTPTPTKFRIALSTAPYEPKVANGTASQPSRAILRFNHVGALESRSVNPDASADASAPAVPHSTDLTELKETVRRLRSAIVDPKTGDYHPWPKPRQIWVPPLPNLLSLGQLADQTSTPLLSEQGWPAAGARTLAPALIGLRDDVSKQEQPAICYDFTSQNLGIVGAPRTGASTLLTTIITSLMATCTPHEVQFYLLDATGSGGSRNLKGAPHVGAAVIGTEIEKLRRMIVQVRQIIRRRAASTPDADDVGAHVFLVVDNLTDQLAHADEDGYKAELLADLGVIARTGLAAKVHLLVSAQTELPIQFSDAITGRIEFRLNEGMSSTIGKRADGTNDADVLKRRPIPGRGLIADAGRVSFFQAALPIRATDAAEIKQLTGLSSDELAKRCGQEVQALAQMALKCWENRPKAPEVRLLPAMIRESEMPPVTTGSGFVLGIQEGSFQPFTFDPARSGPHLLIYGARQHGKTALVRLMLNQLTQLYSHDEAKFILMDPKEELIEWARSPYMLVSNDRDRFGYALNAQMLTNSLSMLPGLLQGRIPDRSQLTLADIQQRDAARQSWSGPRYFIFCDDFEAGAVGNEPFNTVFEYLTHQGDIGLHFIVARPTSDANSPNNVINKLRDRGCARLVLSAERTGLVPGGLALGQSIPPGRGFFVRNDTFDATVQIIYAPPTA